MNRKKYNTITVIVLGILSLGFFYYCYRYALQYNSESTSPTYKNTPALLKLLKYPILFAIYGYSVVSLKWENINWTRRAKVILPLMSIFCIYLLFHTVVFFDFETLKIVLICLIPFLFLLQNKERVNLRIVCRFLNCFYIFAIAYEIIQLMLFLLIGRLPALAYVNTISVRFGGPWDDPNGWGIALSFFIPLAFYYYKQKSEKMFMLLLGIAMLILTQSLTAIGSFLLSFMLSTFILSGNKRWVYLAILILLIICGGFIVSGLYGNLIADYFSMKQGSIDAHASSLDNLMSFHWYNYIVGLDRSVFNESDIVNMLCYGGISLLIVYVMMILCSILFIVDIINMGGECQAFWRASLMYQIAFFLSSFNLPCARMFYLFVIFNVILGITAFYRIKRVKLIPNVHKKKRI